MFPLSLVTGLGLYMEARFGVPRAVFYQLSP